MLKNWTVKTKQIKENIKGLINHFNYLSDNNRKSHIYTKIIDLNNSPKRLQYIIDQYEKRKSTRKIKGLRGGGISNLTTSFVLSIPKDIPQPTIKQWSYIVSVILNDLSKELNIDNSELIKSTIVYYHNEEKSPDKNNHCHMLISNILNNEYEKRITQKVTTTTIKKSFNKAIKKTVNIDNLKYNPKALNIKNKPLWIARKEKEKEKEKENIIDDSYLTGLEKLKNELVINNKVNRKNNYSKTLKNDK
ncbi:hypothetical protein [Photobacterium phosphoreum]|uniref:hypothetical protein n=1 Tax=Photobacterium phosphoreum TaxID=659 RepID=UPI0024331B01|nr:hypothetical protein [Photobacterium phosphoreum]